jgi:antitoxin component YwqK of YwqJK toxin-antitoxin module
MKVDIKEYYPNGELKHKIEFHPNNREYRECFYNEKGTLHRINAPAKQYWYDNGFKRYESYFIKGSYHNICNPSRIWYFEFSKIRWKYYHINDNGDNKLNWMNCIKKIY